MSHASSRGDLGFIPNSRLQMHSRMLMGTSANPSKKGVQMQSYNRTHQDPQQLPETHAVQSIEPTQESMVTKRTDYLEQRVRALTSMVQEQQDSSSKMRERLGDAEEANGAKMQQLFQNTQWLYAKTLTSLQGLDAGGGMNEGIDRYRSSGGGGALTELKGVGSWVLLAYPMERVSVNGETQLMMRMRGVDADTGQLSLSWAVVATERNGETVRHVGQFSFAPELS